MDISKYQKELSQFVSFRSVSTDLQFRPELDECAKWIVDYLKKVGFETELINFGRKAAQIVYASYIVDPEYETVLIYGHYDVQPASESDGWFADPFTLLEKRGRLFARGVVDDKGQLLVHMHTIKELIHKGELKYNVKFLIEGGEESGGPEVIDYLLAHTRKLKSSFVFFSDGETNDNRPTIDASYRGIVVFRLKMKTAKIDAHSGIFGNAIPSASYEMIKFLSKVRGDRGEVLIPGFYDNVLKCTDKERARIKRLDYPLETLEKLTGAKAFDMRKNENFTIATGFKPSVEIQTLVSGYTGTGVANIIPSKSEAVVGFRTVKNQSTAEVISLFEKFVKENIPDFVDVTLDKLESSEPVKLNTELPKYKQCVGLMKETYREDVTYEYVGGSIPIVYHFVKELGVEVLPVSLANEDCNMHGTNENFKVEMIEKALKFSRKFFGK